MYRPLCLCADIPAIQVETRIVVLMHWRGRNLPTNSAHLAHLALANSAIHIRGIRESTVSVSELITPETHAALLYPTPDAVELDDNVVLNLKRPITLFVPDGSWRQARKVSTRENALKDVPHLKLARGAPSTYRLRHTPHEQNLSTFEAIARALGVIEGQTVQYTLEQLFLKMVERKLWSQGKLKASDCHTRIPEGAILASHVAGAAGSRRVP